MTCGQDAQDSRMRTVVICLAFNWWKQVLGFDMFWRRGKPSLGHKAIRRLGRARQLCARVRAYALKKKWRVPWVRARSFQNRTDRPARRRLAADAAQCAGRACGRRPVTGRCAKRQGLATPRRRAQSGEGCRAVGRASGMAGARCQPNEHLRAARAAQGPSEAA
jgi:hypothetical protein